MDKLGIPVTLEWTLTDVRDPHFSLLMHRICTIVVQAFTLIEIGFLKACPEFHDEYCASFEPLFQTGPVAADWQVFKQALAESDWQLVEEKMQVIFKELQLMDYSNVGVDDVYCFVLVSDAASKKLLGYILFYIGLRYPYGEVKVANIALLQTEQNRGLGKLLMSSIFKIIPDIQHIPLSTRLTNITAFMAYKNWGFVPDLNPKEDPSIPEEFGECFDPKHWVYLEYNAEQSDILQKTAEKLLEIK